MAFASVEHGPPTRCAEAAIAEATRSMIIRADARRRGVASELSLRVRSQPATRGRVGPLEDAVGVDCVPPPCAVGHGGVCRVVWLLPLPALTACGCLFFCAEHRRIYTAHARKHRRRPDPPLAVVLAQQIDRIRVLASQ